MGGVAIISTNSMNLLNGNSDSNPNNGNLNPFVDPSTKQNDDINKIAIILGVVMPICVILLILLGCFIKKKLSNRRIII